MDILNKKHILFCTTALYTKSLEFHKKQIDIFFPESEKIIIDGRKNWPNVWYEWIDKSLKTNKEWIIHIDEDCFILNDQSIMNEIDYMLKNNFGIGGCPDGHHEYRNCNHMAINSFFMIIRRDTLIKWKSFLETKKEFPQFKKEWLKPYPFEIKNKSIILESQQWGSWQPGSEPYYNFMWVLKEMGVEFNYMKPGFDSENSCTTLLNNTIIHAWYLRQIDSSKIVSPLHKIENNKRFENIFKIIN
jgi:hypothetical protein